MVYDQQSEAVKLYIISRNVSNSFVSFIDSKDVWKKSSILKRLKEILGGLCKNSAACISAPSWMEKVPHTF